MTFDSAFTLIRHLGDAPLVVQLHGRVWTLAMGCGPVRASLASPEWIGKRKLPGGFSDFSDFSDLQIYRFSDFQISGFQVSILWLLLSFWFPIR